MMKTTKNPFKEPLFLIFILIGTIGAAYIGMLPHHPLMVKIIMCEAWTVVILIAYFITKWLIGGFR